MKKLVVVIGMLVLMTGCNGKQLSLNEEKSLIRSSGDIGVTEILKNQSVDSVDGKAKDILDVVSTIGKFLDSGNVSDLPISKVEIELLKLVPLKYHTIVRAALDVASIQNVSTDKIGRSNIKRIKAFLTGVTVGIVNYSKEDRN